MWRWRESTLRFGAVRAPRCGPGCSLAARVPARLPLLPSRARTRSIPAVEKKRPPIIQKRRPSDWRWRESNPRPKTDTSGILQVYPFLKLSGSARRNRGPLSPYSGNSPVHDPDPMVGKPWFLASSPALKAVCRELVAELTLQPVDNLRYWQLMFLPLLGDRRSTCSQTHLRPSRNRCTPLDEILLSLLKYSCRRK